MLRGSRIWIPEFASLHGHGGRLSQRRGRRSRPALQQSEEKRQTDLLALRHEHAEQERPPEVHVQLLR